MQRVYADHVECGAGWNRCAFPLDLLDTLPGQANRDDGPETEDFFDKGSDVWHFFFRETFLPCIAIRVDSHDFVVSTLLDLLAVGRGKVGDGHDEVSRDSIEAGGYHCQTDRLDLGWFVC